MATDLIHTLKKVAVGDEIAMIAVLQGFHRQLFSQEEQGKIHLFLKVNVEKSHYSIYLRALLYERGLGVKSDPEIAFLLMREAAAAGNANAIYEVGRHFLEGIGVEKHYKNAFEWLKIAAGSPYYVPDAMHDLAIMYAHGLGVEQDLRLAKAWQERAEGAGYKANKMIS